MEVIESQSDEYELSDATVHRIKRIADETLLSQTEVRLIP